MRVSEVAARELHSDSAKAEAFGLSRADDDPIGGCGRSDQCERDCQALSDEVGATG